jgi:hypothetical protein
MKANCTLQHISRIGFFIGCASICLWIWNQRDGERHRADEPVASPRRGETSRIDTLHQPSTRHHSAGPENQEARKAHEALSAAREALASKQMVNLEGVSESDQPATLARFAEQHHAAMVEADALERRLSDPDINPDAKAPIAEAVAAQAHFAAVRQLILNEGLTVEEAEARVTATSQN